MTVVARRIESEQDIKDFFEFPWRLHKGHELWLGTHPSVEGPFHNFEVNPYFAHSRFRYFLAERDGQLAGRLIAHVDMNLQREQQNKWGLFGFFEAENDQEVASALFDTAAGWLVDHGCDRIVGPMEFSTNQHVGLRIEGFEVPPVILEPWHPPYYRELLENWGFEKAVDTLWRSVGFEQFEGWMQQEATKVADRVKHEHGIEVRHISRATAERDLSMYLELMNATLDDSWAHVPLTADEIDFLARATAPLIDERWALLAEKDGKVVGAGISLPDLNQIARETQKSRSPLGAMRMKRAMRKIDQTRALFVGIDPEFQHLGIGIAFLAENMRMAGEVGIKRAELGWSFETNETVNRGLSMLNLEPTRRYRVYDKAL